MSKNGIWPLFDSSLWLRRHKPQTSHFVLWNDAAWNFWRNKRNCLMIYWYKGNSLISEASKEFRYFHLPFFTARFVATVCVPWKHSFLVSLVVKHCLHCSHVNVGTFIFLRLLSRCTACRQRKGQSEKREFRGPNRVAGCIPLHNNFKKIKTSPLHSGFRNWLLESLKHLFFLSKTLCREHVRFFSSQLPVLRSLKKSTDQYH